MQIGFSELLITKLLSYYWNWIWQIQYGERKIKIIQRWSILVSRASAFLEMIDENLAINEQSANTKALTIRV